jgi:hypothetical protein
MAATAARLGQKVVYFGSRVQKAVYLRKLLLKHPGWGSDDTKTFEKDRGGDHTHTHTQCSLFSKVASFLL